MHTQGFSSTPVSLNLIDLALDRTAASQEPSAPAAQQLASKGLAGPAHPQADNPADALPAVKQSNQPACSQQNGHGASMAGAECIGPAKQKSAQQDLGRKVSKKLAKGPRPGAAMPVGAQRSASLDISSQMKQPAADSGPASSTNSLPQYEPGTVRPPAQHAAAARLPPAGLHNGESAKAWHKAQAGSQPGPARKKPKVSPADDAMASRASSGDLLVDAQPAGSNASSCPQQLTTKAAMGKAAGAGKATGKDGKSRKIMSLHAASQDKSLDKSPLQADHLAGLRLDADDGADFHATHSHDMGRRNVSERDPGDPSSNGQASKMGQVATPDPLVLKREVDFMSLALLNDEVAPSHHGVQPAAPRQSRKAPAAASTKPSVLSKRYGSTFIWAQLSGWFKQTVYDPTASLSAERRGTISLPDLESCYSTARQRYTAKVCALHLSIMHAWPYVGRILKDSVQTLGSLS